MSPIRIFALILIIAGALALAYGGFSYVSETHSTTIGPFELAVQEKERVNVPVWAGIGAIVIGGIMLLAGGRRR